MEFIKVDNVKFHYDIDDELNQQQTVNVLDGISMYVEKGEFVALLGHNGCGKSTMAKHFNALLLPSEGKVYVDGMDTGDDEK